MGPSFDHGAHDAEQPRQSERMGDSRGPLLDGCAVVAAGAVAALVFTLLGLPSPALFGGLLAGLVRALAFRRRIAVPTPAMSAAQAVVGVSMGSLIDLGTLRAVAAHWLPVLLVTVGTLLLSLLAGLILRLQPGINNPASIRSRARSRSSPAAPPGSSSWPASSAPTSGWSPSSSTCACC
jgi:hypothetical protein